VLAGGALVRSEVHYRFQSGEELVSENELRFRTRPELVMDLAEAGFAAERLYGDWDRRPAGPGTPELIFVARLTPATCSAWQSANEPTPGTGRPSSR
jgi:hypothetical protein